MSKSQTVRFIHYMEGQGVRVTRTKSGLLCRFPDGSSDMVHFTLSDYRAQANMLARFRRSGVFHPDDPDAKSELPRYVTDGGVSPKTKKQALQIISKLGYPTVITTTDLSPMEGVTASKALFHLGYTPKPVAPGKRPWKRKWVAPEKYIREKLDEVEEPETTNESPVIPASEIAKQGETSAVESTNENPEADLIEENGRLLIDSVDSWVVSVKDVPDDITVKQYLQALVSAGLVGEIRVWKRSAVQIEDESES